MPCCLRYAYTPIRRHYADITPLRCHYYMLRHYDATITFWTPSQPLLNILRHAATDYYTYYATADTPLRRYAMRHFRRRLRHFLRCSAFFSRFATVTLFIVISYAYLPCRC